MRLGILPSWYAATFDRSQHMFVSDPRLHPCIQWSGAAKAALNTLTANLAAEVAAVNSVWTEVTLPTPLVVNG